MDKIDILGRTSVVEQLINILEGLRECGQSMTFSLNGKWGSGKTFVLDLLYERINNVDNKDTNEQSITSHLKPFLYIRYDCWKYDYYSEPLVAFVSAVQDAIEQTNEDGNKKYFSKELKKTGEELGRWIIELLGTFMKAQCGVDASKLILKLLDDNPEKRHKSFDKNFSITKAVDELRNIIKEISEKNTLLIVVDELDRCLPEYMVRVLERLHHLFEGINNVILIVATDRAQLESTIKQIYGETTDAGAYLQKMIQFELSLNVGVVADEERLKEKFSDFLSAFDEHKIPKELDICEFFKAVFGDVEIRRIIHWIEKVNLIHRLTFRGTKPGYDIMYFELFYVALTKIHNINPSSEKIEIDSNESFNMFCHPSRADWRDIPIIAFFRERFGKIRTDRKAGILNEDSDVITINDYVNDLNMMFWYWTRMTEQNVKKYCLPKTTDNSHCIKLNSEAKDNCKCLRKYLDLMDIIN